MVFSCPAQPIATRPIETSAGVFAAASRAKGNARIVETRQDWRGGGAIAGAELPSLAEGRGPLIDLCLAGNEFFYFVRTDARKNAKEKTPKKKGGGTPGDANHHPPHREMRPRALVVSPPRLHEARTRRRARLPAFHRGSCRRDFRRSGSASGQASWDLAGALDPERPLQPGSGDLAPLPGATRPAPVPVQWKHPTRRSLCRQA